MSSGSGTKKRKMNRLFDKEYETRCDFEIGGSEQDEPTRGEYTIYKDGTIETTCVVCKKQVVVNKLRTEKALLNNSILEHETCLDCWKLEQGVKRTEEQDSRRDQIHMGQAINLANQRYWATTPKTQKEMDWETFDKYVDEYYQYIKQQNG